MKNTIPENVRLTLVAEYESYRPHRVRNHRQAAAMFDAIHEEARTCITNLTAFAETAAGAGDLKAARGAMDEVKRHEAVRAWVESLWVKPGERR